MELSDMAKSEILHSLSTSLRSVGDMLVKIISPTVACLIPALSSESMLIMKYLDVVIGEKLRVVIALPVYCAKSHADIHNALLGVLEEVEVNGGGYIAVGKSMFKVYGHSELYGPSNNCEVDRILREAEIL